MIMRFNSLSKDEKDSLFQSSDSATNSSEVVMMKRKYFVTSSELYKRYIKNAKDADKYISHLETILEKHKDSPYLINIFNFDKGVDLETTIIQSLLNCWSIHLKIAF